MNDQRAGEIGPDTYEPSAEQAWVMEKYGDQIIERLPDTRTHKIDEGDPMYHSTCDWGFCDGIATWWRFDRKSGHFLPVCGQCAHKPYKEA